VILLVLQLDLQSLWRLSVHFLYNMKSEGEGCPIGEVAVGEVAVEEVAVGEVAVGEVAVGEVAVGEVAVEEPTCTGNNVLAPDFFLTAFTFPSSEKSQVPIYCWVNREC